MLNREKKSKFTVILAHSSVALGSEIRTSLSQAGYEVFMFNEEASVVLRAKESAPHIIVFSLDILEAGLSDFVQKILNLNSEVLFVPIADAQAADSLLEYREYNFAGQVTAGAGLPARTLWEVDQVCEKIYLTYQNEFLLGSLEKSRTATAQLESELEKNQTVLPAAAAAEFSFAPSLHTYETCKSKEDLIIQF
jgi:hypothetical protein